MTVMISRTVLSWLLVPAFVVVVIGYPRNYHDDGQGYDEMEDMIKALQEARQKSRILDVEAFENIYDLESLNSNEESFEGDDDDEDTEEEEEEGGHHTNGLEAIRGPDELFSGELELDENWPEEDLKIGQVGGLATCSLQQVHVFHRGDRSWDDDAFDEEEQFTHQNDGPIKEATVLMLNKSDGNVIEQWGEDFFYLPHGLTIDSDDNFWMTDVAMHQVFKFKRGSKRPILTLGKPFEPAQSNDDLERFCKPTDVAVATNGDFFIADGYCNSRIMKFDKDGKFLGKFGDEFFVPHSLALAEDLDTICVADREHMRVVCFNAGLQNASMYGTPEIEFSDENLGRVFAIAYDSNSGFLYTVTGRTGGLAPIGVTIDLREDDRFSSDFVATWASDEKYGFDNPHDVAVTPDGEHVFVGEIGPNSVWKFDSRRD